MPYLGSFSQFNFQTQLFSLFLPLFLFFSFLSYFTPILPNLISWLVGLNNINRKNSFHDTNLSMPEMKRASQS
jgi:hypothetical protein